MAMNRFGPIPLRAMLLALGLMLAGGAGDDVLLFDGDDVLVDGGADRDTAIWVGSGAARLALTLNATTSIASGYQRLIGVEQVYGGPGNDVIRDYTDAGVTIHGLAGDDRLTGGRGDDRLDGGTGRDVLTGGAGRDVFGIKDTADTAARADDVRDFGDGDRLDLGDGVTRVWYRQADVNGDRVTDTVLYDNADGRGGIYAVLNAYDDPLTAEDFVRAGVTVTEIV